MSRVTDAMQEAYAAADRADRLIETLELDHPTFADGPVRVVTGLEEPILLPLTLGGDDAEFIPCAFSAVPPGFDDGGPSEWSVSIDNVSGVLTGYLDLTLGSSLPISMTYRAYRSTDLSAPGEVIEGYKLRQVTLTATSASGTIYLEDVSTQAFPRAVYSLDDFPGIWAR